MKPIISVENLAKRYHIHSQKNAEAINLRELLGAIPRKLFKKTSKTEVEDLWVLDDISFDVMPGERIGIIGRNGAGKSTLLKLLSRITEPTRGTITLRGKVASLLEVGTGFHPELTGRENIYLNGAILGMSRAEVDKKFDEIIDFAGIEKFLDTPVKRYSSGMYVRLGFAVAAHLEPDILVVDEVLAVGDAQFQKKCLGKMEEVSQQQGRTVLFVSHNMKTMKELCSKGIYLDKGKIADAGDMAQIAETYYNNNSLTQWKDTSVFLSEKGGYPFMFTHVCVKNSMGKKTSTLSAGEPITVEVHYITKERIEKPCFGIQINSPDGDIFLSSMIYDGLTPDFIEGAGSIMCRFTDIYLAPKTYNVTVRINRADPSIMLAETILRACTFDIVGSPQDYNMCGDKASQLLHITGPPVICNYEWIYDGKHFSYAPK